MCCGAETNNRFCLKIGKAGYVAVQLHRAVHGANYLSRVKTFQWYACVKDGSQDVKDEEWPGGPISVEMAELVKKVSGRTKMDFCVHFRVLEYNFLCNKQTTSHILVPDLRKKDWCSLCTTCFVVLSAACTSWMRKRHLEDFETMQNFLQCAVVSDEIWCFRYDTEVKRQSSYSNLHSHKKERSGCRSSKAR